MAACTDSFVCCLFAAVEHLACGAGLVNIYDFLRAVNPSGRPQSQLQQERDPPSVGMGAMQVTHQSGAITLFILLLRHQRHHLVFLVPVAHAFQDRALQLLDLIFSFI